ncbi:4Fe-4S binding protein [Methanobacterium oryzae]|uniref:4Fe-4S binding protein n=1 Tax=Methanobacterium oryzae TaxID=69540 RepID=UPI003D1F0636
MKFDIERCGCCGACVGVCPNNSLELTENRIIIENDKCNDCGRCNIVCPLGAFLEAMG